MRARLIFTALLATASATGCEQPGESGNNTGDGSAEAVSCVDGVCTLSGEITEDLTLTADTVWLLRGGVFIGDDEERTVLTIEPGTIIYGESSTNGMLVVTRGSQIIAEGTAEAPIVFTSSKEEGTRARGDWGGLILNGRAPVNGCDAAPCESFGEGGTGYYGGGDAEDNSGVLKYVRVEFAGSLISPDNELNGLALQGVGRGTVIDFVQIHMGADDCIEFFGGTAQVKHILCTGAADDNLDWTDGWQGKAQFVVVKQYDDAGDNGIEADNNGEDNTATPRSHPVISNITLIGAPESDASDIGILLREGTAGEVHNAIVMGFGESCLDIDHDETFANAADDTGAPTGELVIAHSFFDCARPFGEDASDPFSVADFVLNENEGNSENNPELASPYEGSADYRPLQTSPAMGGAVVPDDSFFEQVSYRGAIDPLNDWTAGWTVDDRS